MSSNRAYPGQTPYVPGAAPSQVPGFVRPLQTDLPARLQPQNAPVASPGGGSVGFEQIIAALNNKDPAALQNLQRQFRFGSQLPMRQAPIAPASPQQPLPYGYGNLNQYILSMQQQQQPTMLQPRPDLSNRAYK